MSDSRRTNLVNKLAFIHNDAACPDEVDTSYGLAESFVKDLSDDELDEYLDIEAQVYFDASVYDFVIDYESNYY